MGTHGDPARWRADRELVEQARRAAEEGSSSRQLLEWAVRTIDAAVAGGDDAGAALMDPPLEQRLEDARTDLQRIADAAPEQRAELVRRVVRALYPEQDPPPT